MNHISSKAMQISPILLGGLILGMTLFGQAFAQSTGGDTSVTIDEELVHRMVNGTFVIERQPVQITTIVMPPSATGTGESDTRPWHVIRGFESKINPLLQLEIDNKKKICTYELIFDDCPPLDRNADGEEIINAYILLQEIELWPNGWPNPDKYPTDEQKDKRRAEKNKEVAMSQQPFIEFLESNNQTVMHRFELINAISADITIRCYAY